MPSPSHEAPQEKVELLLHLLSISRGVRALMGIKLAEIGVVAGQDQLLLYLRERGACPVGSTAEDLVIRPSTVSKMVSLFGRRGWATRETSEADARRTIIRLTDAGLRVADAVLRVHEELDAELASSLNGDAASCIADLDHLVTKRLRRLR